MRPLHLEMKGFGPFRDATVVDFTDVDVVALVGPTGAGKSTIIDAITFALYGSVVRYDDRSAVAPAVNQLSSEARVLLDFEVEGIDHRVIRVVRRTATGASTREARLERGDQVLAAGVGEVGPAVERLLGLDVDRFNRTVVLPQGRFATFLHDRPGERQEVLRQLLDLAVYTRMGAAARESARTAQAQLDVLEPLIGGDVPTDDALAAMRADADALAVAADEARDTVAQHDKATALAQELAHHAHDLGVLALALAAVQVPAEVDVLVGELDDARAAKDSTAATLSAARAVLEDAIRSAEDGPNPEVARRLLEDHAGLAQARREVETSAASAEAAEAEAAGAIAAAAAERERRGELDEAIESTRAALDEARRRQAAGPDPREFAVVARRRDELADAQATLERRRDEISQAEAAHGRAVANHDDHVRFAAEAAEVVDGARMAAGAAGLLSGVGPGDPCPVCRRVLDELPDHDVDAELAAAVAHHDEATEEQAVARSALDEAIRRRSTAEADLRSADEQMRALETALASAPDAAAVASGLAESEELAATVAAAAAAATAAETARRRALADPLAKELLGEEVRAVEVRDAVVRDRDRAIALRDDYAARLEGAPDEVALRAAIAAADAFAAARERARGDVAAAEAALAEADQRRGHLASQEEAARRALASTRDAFVGLGAPPADGPLAAAWATFAHWASETASATNAPTATSAPGPRQRARSAKRSTPDCTLWPSVGCPRRIRVLPSHFPRRSWCATRWWRRRWARGWRARWHNAARPRPASVRRTSAIFVSRRRSTQKSDASSMPVGSSAG